MPEKTVSGKLVHEGGKYVLVAGRNRYEIPAGTDEAALQQLAGGAVEVTLSAPVTFPVAIRAGAAADERIKRIWILCYVPPPDIFRQLVVATNPEVRTQFAKKFLDAKIISPETHARLTGKG